MKLVVLEVKSFQSDPHRRMAGDKDSKDEVPTIADDLVVTKYKMAAEIVNSE